MTAMLHLDLVTPEALILSAPVEMVVVPGALGDMGIMANHAPIVSLLRAGTVEVHTGDAVRSYYVAGGYVEIHDNHCTVLAEHVMDTQQASA
ncbi:MAG: ATP synthase F1 subunit epsilon [Rickettsiales bacterium]|nr:ATP synthase F1 subunit epsilon [Rickettsiales bacterium]